MNTRANTIKKLLALVALLPASAGLMPLSAAPATTTATPPKIEMPQSVFIYPSKPQEGKDPFYPTSLRPYADNPNKKTSAPSLTDLVFKGILPGPRGALALINDSTFSTGEEGDVITKSGKRMTIRCLNINIKANTVMVEANGASAILSMSQN
jgi:hypothetical protein